LVGLVPLLIFASFVVFLLTYLAPGNPAVAVAGPDATPHQIARVSHELGLDRPVLEQYWNWLVRVLHGNFGKSLFSGQKVTTEIGQRLPVDLTMVGGSILIAIILGTPLGMIAAVRRGTWVDKLVNFLASLGVSIPTFWLGIIFLQEFAVAVHWFPSSGYVGPTQSISGWLSHMFLPCLCLSLSAAGDLARQVRTAMVTALEQDYIRTAMAKGVPRYVIVIKHAMRNSLLPSITIIGLALPALIGGTVTTETIFGLPGIGQLMLSSVASHDIPIIQGVILCAVLTVVVSNSFLDVVYRVVDPSLTD
jgi:peptide/nickel transport system permease protein